MRYLSVCSGIEAATVAWHDLGWEAAAYSEIEKFPSAVLAHHYPHVPNLGDMTKFKEWPNDSIDLLVGGTPCQSFSVAGLRKGLADPRGNLMLTFGAIADKYRPRWLVWENVPGVLSSNRGRDFAAFLGTLEELGYGFAYRILDAQYFGVAQRRRRIFVVGYLGDWRPAAAVLFECESLCGNPAPSRKEGQEITPTIRSGAANGSPAHGQRSGDSRDELITVCAKMTAFGEYSEDGTVSTLKQRDDKDATDLVVANTLKDYGNGASIAFNARQDPYSWVERTGPLDTDGSTQAVAVGFDAFNNSVTGDLSKTLDTGQDYHHVPNGMQSMAVRRITPTECERLQGFPDGYTDIKPKDRDTPDGPRYKALGNSMAVPVMRWVGERIEMVENIQRRIG